MKFSNRQFINDEKFKRTKTSSLINFVFSDDQCRYTEDWNQGYRRSSTTSPPARKLPSSSGFSERYRDNKVFVKLGPKTDLRNLNPSNFHVSASGQDYAVWE
ncbi:alpha-amylase [Trifolium repens]|nr:alpha-amylase [Trifolium repens]